MLQKRNPQLPEPTIHQAVKHVYESENVDDDADDSDFKSDKSKRRTSTRIHRAHLNLMFEDFKRLQAMNTTLGPDEYLNGKSTMLVELKTKSPNFAHLRKKFLELFKEQK